MGSPISLQMLGMSPVHTPLPHPSDICPSISPTLPLTESAKEKRAARMIDEELVRHVEGKLRRIGESLRHLIPYLREARARYAHPGRRVPVSGEPTFGEWIRQNLGVSDRHVRRLLAAVKEPTDFSRGESEQAPKQQRRDEVMWHASRLSLAILGLDESDERDPSGLQRRAAITAMAYKFLNLMRRKQIPVSFG